jgi:outer membrane protein
MSRFRGRTFFMVCLLLAEGITFAQKAPPVPEHPWDASSAKPAFPAAPPHTMPAPIPDPAKIYALPELVDIAERNNPQTRVAWENAKGRAADLGITRSTLYPTLAAAALAESTRLDIFFGPNFQRQTVETFSPVFVLDYIIFDFGRRSQEVSVSRNNLLAALSPARQQRTGRRRRSQPEECADGATGGRRAAKESAVWRGARCWKMFLAFRQGEVFFT